MKDVDEASGMHYWRAVMAVAKRWLTTYIRYPTWVISVLLWPVLFPFGYVFSMRALAGPTGEALSSFAQLAGTTDYVTFLVTGTTFWMWFNIMLWGLGGSFRMEQLRGTLESNWLAPLPKTFLAVGVFLAEALMGLVQLSMSMLTIALVYGVRLAGSPWALLSLILISIPSIYGTGLIFASLVLVAKEINGLIFFVRGLITVFCGVTYPIAVLPGWMQSVSRVLPLSHSVSAVRAVLAGGGFGTIAGQLRYLAVSGAVLMALGFLAYAIIQRRMLHAGTLGQH
ncbi:MAG: ABC transporter permease [Bacillota bacterium]|nr:ABC transporter permease [Bacillota bacterium]